MSGGPLAPLRVGARWRAARGTGRRDGRDDDCGSRASLWRRRRHRRDAQRAVAARVADHRQELRGARRCRAASSLVAATTHGSTGRVVGRRRHVLSVRREQGVAERDGGQRVGRHDVDRGVQDDELGDECAERARRRRRRDDLVRRPVEVHRRRGGIAEEERDGRGEGDVDRRRRQERRAEDPVQRERRVGMLVVVVTSRAHGRADLRHRVVERARERDDGRRRGGDSRRRSLRVESHARTSFSQRGAVDAFEQRLVRGDAEDANLVAGGRRAVSFRRRRRRRDADAARHGRRVLLARARAVLVARMGRLGHDVAARGRAAGSLWGARRRHCGASANGDARRGRRGRLRAGLLGGTDRAPQLHRLERDLRPRFRSEERGPLTPLGRRCY
mmetsp:Transcript_15407/g.62006  ORF Transcript_15407/g.62006 Transcript_15407/m.62006 type:complete len:389 (-) Transcript_15407:976-2142(-)